LREANQDFTKPFDNLHMRAERETAGTFIAVSSFYSYIAFSARSRTLFLYLYVY